MSAEKLRFGRDGAHTLPLSASAVNLTVLLFVHLINGNRVNGNRGESLSLPVLRIEDT
jgi:hypothetical protein